MHGLGQKIYMARKVKKYSQAQLAEKIGKSRAVVSAYENDLKTPSGETLIDLAVVLDISLDYLVGFVNRRSVVVAVSYTHLDVYKRQLPSLRRLPPGDGGILRG